MDYFEEFQQKIENSIDSTGVSATGYYQVRCPVCDDYIVRAGFKFDGNEIIYNCFRGKCDASTVQRRGVEVNGRFKRVMNAFGIKIPLEMLLENSKNEYDKDLFKQHEYKELKLPYGFKRYRPNKHHEIKEYLESRNVDTEDFYYKGHRLLIPFYFKDVLIGWQIVNTKTGEYYKSTGNNYMLFLPNGYVPREPIVTEGVFDALVVPNGVAVLNNKIYPQQAYFMLNSSPILLPDRKDSKFLDMAKLYNWRISIPDNKSWKNEKDANEFAVRWGKFALAREIGKGITNDYKYAKGRYDIWKS